MATQCVVFLIFAYVLFGSQQTLASPIGFNVSNAVTAVRNFSGKVINGAKTLLGFSSETTTINPPTTTKASLNIVFIPKGFTKKVSDVSNNETTNLTTETHSAINVSKSCKGFLQKSKCIWNKTKNLIGLTRATTAPPPRNTLLVPVDWKVMRHPCQGKANQDCRLTAQASSFSWWTLSLSLTGALLMGAAAWIVYTRNRALGTPTLWEYLRPQKLSWWYTSKPDSHISTSAAWYPAGITPAISSRGPAPLPKPAGSPPTIPLPPVPATAGSERLCANTLYQVTTVPDHMYATPTATPYSAWSSRTNEHVHVYEIPPCFPSYDLADQEIDTTTLKKTPNSTKQAKC